MNGARVTNVGRSSDAASSWRAPETSPIVKVSGVYHSSRTDDHEDRSDVIEHLLRRPEWHARAACKGMTDVMFPRSRGNGPAWSEAQQVCMRCPVRVECCAAADERKEAYGMWGGKRRQPQANHVDFGWLLTQKEWTPVELAEATGVHVQSVRRWLRAAVNAGHVLERVDPSNRARRLYKAAEERRSA